MIRTCVCVGFGVAVNYAMSRLYNYNIFIHNMMVKKTQQTHQDADAAVATYAHVFRLEVAVNKVLVVKVAEGVTQFAHDAASHPARTRTHICNAYTNGRRDR